MSTGLENELLDDTTEALPSEEEVVEYNGNREYDPGENTGTYGYVEVEIDGEMKQCTNAYTSNAYGGQYCVGDTYTDPNGGNSPISGISVHGLQMGQSLWDAEETYADAGEKMGMTLEQWTDFSAEIQALNETVAGLKGNMFGPTEMERGRLGIRISQENPDWTEEQVMAEADKMLEEKWMTSDAYREAALAETALFAKYGITKPNPAVYGSGIFVDSEGKNHMFESSTGNYYQTSQDTSFLDVVVPLGIGIGASLIAGGGFTSMLGSSGVLGGLGSGMGGIAQGAWTGLVGSAAGQGVMGNGIDPKKLLQAAMLGGLGGLVDGLSKMDGSIMDNAIMGGADSVVSKVSDMLNMGYDDALDLVAGIVEGTIKGGDLESIIGGVISTYGTSKIQDYLTGAFGNVVNVDDWFKDGQSHIPMEAFTPIIKGSIEAALEGGVSVEDALKMAWGYFDNGGDIDFMLPGFMDIVSSIPGLDFEKGGWGIGYDEESGDIVINHNFDFDFDWQGVGSLPELGNPCTSAEGQEGKIGAGSLEGSFICEGIEIAPNGTDCDDGFNWDSLLGQCVEIDIFENGTDCEDGFNWDTLLGQCVEILPNGTDCEDGFGWDSLLGQCVDISIDPQGCGEGETWDELLGNCVPDVVECIEGFEWDGQTCVEISPNQICEGGETWDEALGTCIPDVVECIEGFEWDGQTCVEIPDVAVDGTDCEEGFNWDSLLGQCVEIDIVECIEGFEWDGQTCVEIETKGPELTCPEGFRNEDGQCLEIDIDTTSTPPEPENSISSNGSTWSDLFAFTPVSSPALSKYAPVVGQVKGMFNGLS